MMNEKIINLFSELDNEIVQHKVKIDNQLIKVVYELGDQTCYYAMFSTEEGLIKKIESFQNLPNIVLSAAGVKNMLEIILSNCEIYYQLQEYVRYEKVVTENNSSMYEANYLSMKQNILAQLQFLSTLTPLLHKEVSASFPNLEYRDIPVERFYEGIIPADEMEENKQRVIMMILASTTPMAITTKDILQVEYSKEALSQLRQMTLLDTNTDKIEEYINLRKKELDALVGMEKINANLTRNMDSLFKDVNTVFDLHAAAFISDKVYQKGQGVFAIGDFALSGRIIRFTSQYDARKLASEVDHELYKNILIKNVLLNVLIEKDNVAYEKLVFLLKQNDVSLDKVSELLFNHMPLLMVAVDHFNYKLLNYTSSYTQGILSMLNKEETSLLEQNIKKLLQELKAL